MNKQDNDHIDVLIDMLEKQAGVQDAAVQPLVEMHQQCEREVETITQKEAAQADRLQELYRHLGTTLLSQ